jgi:hypothetical protein
MCLRTLAKLLLNRLCGISRGVYAAANSGKYPYEASDYCQEYAPDGRNICSDTGEQNETGLDDCPDAEKDRWYRSAIYTCSVTEDGHLRPRYLVPSFFASRSFSL